MIGPNFFRGEHKACERTPYAIVGTGTNSSFSPKGYHYRIYNELPSNLHSRQSVHPSSQSVHQSSHLAIFSLVRDFDFWTVLLSGSSAYTELRAVEGRKALTMLFHLQRGTRQQSTDVLLLEVRSSTIRRRERALERVLSLCLIPY